MRYVVTGGAGFIGGRLSADLAAAGHRVDIVDSLHAGSTPPDGPGTRFFGADVRDGDEMGRIVGGCDGVFHLAALTSAPGSFENPGEYAEVNVRGTRNVLEAAAECGARTVLASSAAVYGPAAGGPAAEDDPVRPASPYGRTKLECERMAASYSGRGRGVVVLRYFNVYGPGQDPGAGVVSRFLADARAGRPMGIFGDGRQTRDFVHVGDVARASIAAMEGPAGSGTFNVGTGTATSIGALAGLVAAITGARGGTRPLGPREGDAESSVADTSRAADVLGWRASTALEDGVREAASVP